MLRHVLMRGPTLTMKNVVKSVTRGSIRHATLLVVPKIGSPFACELNIVRSSLGSFGRIVHLPLSLFLAPKLMSDDLVRCGSAHTEVGTQNMERHRVIVVIGPHRPHAIPCQFRSSNSLTDCGCASSLLVHITHIVEMCSRPKVCRIDTDRVITAMANIDPIRNRAIRKFKRNTMRVEIFSCRFRSKPESTVVTISTMKNTARPNPTVVCLLDLRPKSLEILVVHRVVPVVRSRCTSFPRLTACALVTACPPLA